MKRVIDTVERLAAADARAEAAYERAQADLAKRRGNIVRQVAAIIRRYTETRDSAARDDFRAAKKALRSNLEAHEARSLLAVATALAGVR